MAFSNFAQFAVLWVAVILWSRNCNKLWHLAVIRNGTLIFSFHYGGSINILATVKKILLPFVLITVFSPKDSLSGQDRCFDLFTNEAPSVDSNQRLRAAFNHLNTSLDFKTSGFESNERIILAALESDGFMAQYYHRAYEILKNENLEVGIRLPFNIRLKVANNGLLNSYESETSQGAGSSRDIIEASYSNMSLEEYALLPIKMRPKYAAAFPQDDQLLASPRSLDSYAGSDTYFFKMHKIRERLTFTPGDSLNRFTYWNGSMWEVKKPESWDQMFVTWKNRFLLIPCVADGLSRGRFGFAKVGKPGKYQRPSEYGYQSPIVGTSKLEPYKMKWSPNMDYIELQIWGELTLDDVSVFEYRASPPKGKFLAELQKRGIIIRPAKK